jgi:hypothetical protein
MDSFSPGPAACPGSKHDSELKAVDARPSPRKRFDHFVARAVAQAMLVSSARLRRAWFPPAERSVALPFPSQLVFAFSFFPRAHALSS